MDSLAGARAEYEQKTQHAITVVRSALLLHIYRTVIIAHIQGGVPWIAWQWKQRHFAPLKHQ